MIEPMVKLLIASTRESGSRLLDALQEAGLVHILPVEPAAVEADQEILHQLDQVRQAQAHLAAQPVLKLDCQITSDNPVGDVLRLVAELSERVEALKSSISQLKEQECWGQVSASDLRELAESGVNLRFALVPSKEIEECTASLLVRIGPPVSQKQLVALVCLAEPVELPNGAEELMLPSEDNASLRRRIALLEEEIKERRQLLAAFKQFEEQLTEKLLELSDQLQYGLVLKSSLQDEDLFIVQGWVPAVQQAQVRQRLEEKNLNVAIKALPAQPDELPPTKLRYSPLVRPIEALFNVLGTYPGYWERDLSAFFVVALPLFAGMLIGDAGYGLLFLLPSFLFRRALISKAGVEAANLLMLVGLATFVFGALTANYFGITPDIMASLANVAGEGKAQISGLMTNSTIYGVVGRWMLRFGLLWDIDPTVSQEKLTKLSFMIGCIHLVLAHVRVAWEAGVSQKALAELGWGIFIGAMFGVVWLLFFGEEALPVTPNVIVNGLIAGATLTILFNAPNRNPFKRVAFGFFSSLLAWLGAFSDLMSYIRLMAVGLASYYIATATNQIAAQTAAVAGWGAAIPILLIGHGLNIALGVIAIFAHGVRLNMLEFSNNAGVQWGGYEYRPFAKIKSK